MFNKMVALAGAMTLTSAIYAQTWVSAANGNDGNSCTRSAPCRTYQRALNVTPAWSEVHVADPGEYGPVNITQAVTIDGGGMGTTLATSGYAFQVNAPAGAVVQLRNLAIHGNGAWIGILYNSGSQLVVENVKLNGFNNDCLYAGISGSAADLVIKDSSIDNCSSAAIAIDSGSALTVEIANTHVHYANLGIWAQAGYITVSGSTFSSPAYGGNGYGIDLAAGNPTMMIDNSTISGFGVGILSNAGTVQVSRSTFANNSSGLQGSIGSTMISNGNNSFFNNTSNGFFNKTVSLQ